MNAYKLTNGIVLSFWIGFSGMAATHDAWNIRSSASSNRLNGVAYGNGLFVAVGDQTTILTSLNGRDWTVRPAGTTAPTIWSAAYGNGRYVLGGGEDALIRSSTDGLHWTNGLSTIGAENINAIAYGYAYGNGLFVAVGRGEQVNTSYVLTSSNGLDWVSRNVPTTNTLFGISPCFANGVGWAEDFFVAVGDRGTIMTSTNGVNWVVRNSGTTVTLRAVLFHQSKMMVLGDSGIVLASTDGASWSNAAPASFNIRGAASSWDAIVAVGNYLTEGRLHASTDGLAWPGLSIEFPHRLNAITCGAGSFVAVGDGGLIVQSDTANFWTKPTSGDWQERDSWSLGVLPGRMQSVAIVNPGWKAVAISPTTPVNFPASLTVNDLTVGCSGAGWNTLLLNFFGTAVPLRVLNGMSILGGGTVMNLSSGLLVENGPLSISGSLNQDDGYTRVENGSLDISGLLVQNGGYVRVENGPLDIHGSLAQNGGYVQATNVTTYVDGNGAYSLTNGTFQGGVVQLGVDSLGSFNQYGGEANVNSLTVGGTTIGFGSGIYNLYGGNLAVRDTLHVGGYYRSGEFFQFGGTNASSLLKVSPFWMGPAIYHLNGGSLNTDFSWISGTDFVSTTFEQNGGSHIVANTLTLYGSQSHGGNGHQTKYLLKDGILSARFIKLDGGGGYNVFAQTNGTTSVSDTLFLNWGQSMYIGNVFLHGGTMVCENVLSQAAGDNILQTGGNFIVTNLFSFGGHTSYGYPESPIYKFNGGTLTASNIDLSAAWVIGSSAQTGRVTNPGYFKLSGSLQISNATEQLGRFILASNATINMAGSNSVLSFADSNAENWNEASLLIVWNWNGLLGGGGADQLKFGTNQFALTTAQLGRIRFGAGYPTQLTGVRILNTGEVVPDELVRPSILSACQENSLVLGWPPGWVLQSATNVAGPYTDVPGAASPYTHTNDMTAGTQRFFRLRPF